MSAQYFAIEMVLKDALKNNFSKKNHTRNFENLFIPSHEK